MIKVNFKPKKDIKQYLTDDFNITIYEELTQNDEWEGVFEPLEFFNIFYENVQIIYSNIDNPEGFIKHLKGLKFNSKKYFFLIGKLRDELLSVAVHMPEYEKLMDFYKYLDSEYNEGFAILYPEKVKEQQREALKWLEEQEKRANEYFAQFTSFDDVEKDLELIDDIQEKIKILIKHKARFLKEKEDFSLDDKFGEKCQIEIDMLKELAEIDTPPPQTMIENNPKKYTAKHYVLAYLIECNAKGISLPNGQKKELEKIGNKRMGAGKGNRFYKVFNEVVNKDINAEKNLIEIGGENWRTIVKDLSSEPDKIGAYLQSKQL